jgi:hypothetical protein
VPNPTEVFRHGIWFSQCRKRVGVPAQHTAAKPSNAKSEKFTTGPMEFNINLWTWALAEVEPIIFATRMLTLRQLEIVPAPILQTRFLACQRSQHFWM